MQKTWNIDTQSMKPAYPYRTKWVCFDCRKSLPKSVNRKTTQPILCVSCQKPMTDMGYLFEPPKKSNHKQWKIMALLADNAICFHSTGNVAYIRNNLTNDAKATYSEVENNIKTHFTSSS